MTQATATIPDSQPLAMMTAGDLRLLIAEEWNRHAEELAQKAENPKVEASPYLFGKAEIAKELHITTTTRDRWRSAGKLDGLVVKVGGQLRANRDKLNQGIEKKFIQ